MSSAFDRLSKKSTVSDVHVSSNERIRIDEIIEFADLTDGEWHQVRLYPGVFADAMYWIDITKKDGSYTQIPKFARNFNINTATFDDSKFCPYYENQDLLKNRGEPGLRANIHYYMNGLDREVQDAEPKKLTISKPESKTGFKVKKSSSWTPIRVFRLPKTAIENLKKLKDLNRHNGRTYDLSDPKYGRDIYIMYDGNADGSAKWQVQLVDNKEARKALSSTEKDYLLWDIESALERIRENETDEEAAAWVSRQTDRNVEIKKDIKSKQKDFFDENDDNDDVVDIDIDDIEKPEEKPKKRKKNVKKSKKDIIEKKFSLDEEDIEESEEKSKKSKKGKKNKSIIDLDEPTEEKPKKKKKGKK